MDPGTIILVGATYAAAAVLRKAGDDIAEGVWNRVKAALRAALGHEPEITDVTQPQLAAAVSRDPSLIGDLENLWGATGVLRRADLVKCALEGARILWIDDHPDYCQLERECLVGLGVHVECRETTKTALECLETNQFDFILSDISRASSPTAGLDALPAIKAASDGRLIIFYVMDLRGGVPSGAFGITNRPDELLHLCMDAAERTRI